MFEQELVNFLAQLVADGVFINANLTGVNEPNQVGDAITNTITDYGVIEDKIYLYKQDGQIKYKSLKTNTMKENIQVIDPKRIALEGETLPIKEVIEEPNKAPQIRYDFSETTENGVRYFNFKYANVVENTRDSIINAIIRQRYTSDNETALLRNKISGGGGDSLAFLRYNNWVDYAKGVADGIDLTPIKEETKYEIIIPLNLCDLNADYGGMAFQTLVKNIVFEADAINNVAKAYPSWVLESDLAIISQDPRVTVNIITLYQEQ